jgi:3-isopropylmalate dehydrogenase
MAMRALFLAGDGIGPEVLDQAERIVAVLNEKAGLGLEVRHDKIGGTSIDRHGVPIREEVVEAARASTIVIVGAVGGPKWVGVPYERRPEQGLATLRKSLDVFANLRPAFCFPALSEASTMRPEYIEGLDILFVRELTGGIYFGSPRGIDTLPDGQRRGLNTHVYTTSEIHRVARVAFKLARSRRGKVCSVEKGNIMEAGLLWREEVAALHAAEAPDLELTHMYADNCAMQLVRAPKQFDVILADNLFGDMLSDEAGMLTGSLGMLPSAALGKDGMPGLYEPIHGSAPDIAGQGVANPCGAILSLAMALRLQLGRADLAEKIEAAIGQALNDGIRTRDMISGPNTQLVGTAGMGSALIERLGL